MGGPLLSGALALWVAAAVVAQAPDVETAPAERPLTTRQGEADPTPMPADAPLLAPPVREPIQRRSFVLPLLEAEFIHLGFGAFSNLVTREHFAAVSWDSIRSHFDGRAPWTIDVDYFLTNQFGHPYQGALSFTAARSSGLGFWWATLYPLLASLSWELLFEVDNPSINDQITTTLGGIFLGEMLHRSAELILATGRGESNIVRQIAAGLIDPMAALNRWLFDGALKADGDEGRPHFYGQIAAGMNVASFLIDRTTQERLGQGGPSFTIQGLVTYGNPGDPEFRYNLPFSHFDLSAALSLPAVDVSTYVFVRGLLVGAQYGNAHGRLRGVWGLFGQYDFASAGQVRISSVGVGPGTTLQWQLTHNLFLQGSAVLSGVPFAAGSNLDLDENAYRNYHAGPGAQGVVEARLIHREAGMLRITARDWFTTGAYMAPNGWENIAYFTFSFLLRLYGPVAAGLDMTLALQRSRFEDATYDRALQGGLMRLTLAYVSDDGFGANAAVR